MNDFLNRAELVLTQEAGKYTPEGSTARSVVHQWLNAIAYGKSLFGEKSGAEKEHLISLLSKEGLFENKDTLRQNLHTGVKLKPVEQPDFTFIDLFAGIGGFRLASQEHKSLRASVVGGG